MIRWAGRQKDLNNSFFQRVWGLIYPWLIYQGILMAVTYFFALFMVLRDPSFLPTSGSTLEASLRFSDQVMAYYLPLSLGASLLTIPLLLFFIRRDRKIEEQEGYASERWEKPAVLAYPLCFLCGASACIVLNHVLIYSGLYALLEEGYSDTAQILFSGNLWLELLVIGLVTPLVEELIFRGLIYRRIRYLLEALPAMALSSLLFALFHGNLLQGIYSFLLGLLLAFVYERTHSLLAPICIHAGANLVSVLMTDLESLSKVYEPGNETAFLLLTGGMMLLFVICFYLFYVRICPRCLDAEEGTPQLSLKEEE